MRTIRTVPRIVLSISLLLAPVPVFAAEPIPNVIHPTNANLPWTVWMSSSYVTSQSGGVRWELFRPTMRKVLQSVATRCPSIEVQDRRLDLRPNQSVRDLVRHARAVVVGVVDGEASGFFEEYPATLLSVNVTEMLAGAPLTDNRLLVAHPEARFAAGDRTFCRSGDGFVSRPAIGDRIVLFVYDLLPYAAMPLIVPEPTELLRLQHDDTIVWPRALAHDELAPSKLAALRTLFH
ncbi:MAG TPA: hypothetical protein VF824_11575 [Thermoanaerobaculia bacterium]|jgi:hypothetical protein